MWTSTDHKPSKEPFTPVVRPTAATAIVGQPLADYPTLFRVHRWQRRTVPCDHPTCLLCRELLVVEHRIYLPILDYRTSSIALLDLPETHWTTLKRFEIENSGLRSCVLKSYRTRPQDNAPIALLARELKSSDQSYDRELDPVPIFTAITASNKEKAVFDLLCGKSNAPESSRLNDRAPT